MKYPINQRTSRNGACQIIAIPSYGENPGIASGTNNKISNGVIVFGIFFTPILPNKTKMLAINMSDKISIK